MLISSETQVEAHPMVAAYGTSEWNELSESERQLSEKKMEVSKISLYSPSAPVANLPE